ncbi:MAG TPA: sulfatase-like hydrolase/transferase, partial [Polyangia bacterium]|nr:sulfatase-like hydrolase/transferase [Polyangia bacterium]
MSAPLDLTAGPDATTARALPVLLAAAATLAAFAMSCGGSSGAKPSHDGGAPGSDAAATVDAAGGAPADAAASSAAGAGASGAAGASAAGAGGAMAAGGAGGASAAGGGGGAPTHANIVFVLVDDLSMNLVQYMPHVLQMQRVGATFNNYFVADSLCCPSRTSMFTGKFPHNSGVFTNTGDDGGYATFISRGNDPQTFAVALQGGGYRTAMLGKYLNGYLPAMNQASMGWTGWGVAGDGYPEFDYDLNQNGKVVHYAHAATDYLTDVISGLGQTFIGQKA